MPNYLCPLCRAESATGFHRDKNREYFQCRHCHLVFVPPHQHLNPDKEKAVYELHQNRLDDPGYRRFLSRLATPLLERLPAMAKGLDYGCGPGPLLANMLTEHGHGISLYDPFYADNQQLLGEQYDFVTCTEVVEHFRQPHLEFQRLFGMLKPQGLLGIMTKLVIDAQAFSRWHYKNDLTHVGFFSETTLRWLAKKYHCRLDIIGKDVIIFQRLP